MSEPVNKVEPTPGPWQWSNEYRDLGWVNDPNAMVLVGPDGKAVLDACAFHEDASLRSDYPDDVANANAALIAAAPELLDALTNTTQTLRLMNVVNTNGPSREEVRKEIALADAAIKKARGRVGG